MTAATQRQRVGERRPSGLGRELDDRPGAGGDREQGVEEQQHLVRAGPLGAARSPARAGHSVIIIRTLIDRDRHRGHGDDAERPGAAVVLRPGRSASGTTQTDTIR